MNEERKGRSVLDYGLAAVGAILVFVAIMAANIALDAFVLVKLWAWFVAPTFGIPLLSMKVAAGISTIAALLTHQSMPQRETKKILAYHIIVPLMALLTGFIITKL